jgi:hypothetical protein
VSLDGPDLVADLHNAPDVGVPDDVDEAERALAGRHLDEHLDVHVLVLDESPAPVPVGVHLGMARGCPAHAGHHVCSQRQGRVAPSEHPASGGEVDLEQPDHGDDPPTSPYSRRDQPPARRERP